MMRAITGGPLMAHSRDVLALPPELMRIDLVSFAFDIGPRGQVTGDTQASLHADFAAELYAISAFAEDPTADLPLAPFVTINLREDGRNFDHFTTPIELAYFLRPGAPAVTFPRGAYVFRPGARVRLGVRVHPEYIARTSVPKRWGVLLALNLWRSE